MKKLRIYGEMWGACVGMSLLAGIVVSMVSGVLFMEGGAYLFQTIGIYCMVVGAMILLITPFSMYQSYVPMILSMNGRRREVFRNFQLLKLVNALSVAALGGILLILQSLLKGGMSFGDGLAFFVLGLGFLLVMSSVGNLSGVVFSRFGKLGLALFMLCSAAAGGVIGFVSAMTQKKGIKEIVWRIGDGNMEMGIIGVIIAAVILTVVDGVISWVIIRNMEVRG